MRFTGNLTYTNMYLFYGLKKRHNFYNLYPKVTLKLDYLRISHKCVNFLVMAAIFPY